MLPLEDQETNGVKNAPQVFDNISYNVVRLIRQHSWDARIYHIDHLVRHRIYTKGKLLQQNDLQEIFRIKLKLC